MTKIHAHTLVEAAPRVSRATYRRAALTGGVIGNYVDQVNIFLPALALAPAMKTLAGPSAASSGTAIVVMAMLLGRPVGATVFGRIADRAGRTRTTAVAIAGTAACTLLIAALPTHRVLGGATFALLVALRFVGGMFIAGEYSAAVPLAMEWSAPRHRGLFSGLIMAMAPCAQATIAFVTAGMLMALGPESYAAWGWRLPFVAGGLASCAMFVFYRRHVADATRAVRPGIDEAGTRGSLREVVLGPWRGAFWRMFCLMSGLWLMTQMVVLLLGQRLVSDAGLSAGRASVVMGFASVGQALVMALTGHLSTLVGRRRYFLFATTIAAVGGSAAWLWMMGTGPGLVGLIVGAVLAQVLTVTAYGPVGAYLSEAFPANVRSTGYGTAYSASIVLPALYPYWLPWLAGGTSRNAAVVLVLIAGSALVSLGAALGPRLAPAEIEQVAV
ncbi:MFS transporter [Luteococcus japonicus]|uniref:Alpha-ketoglutarate permease n=1 Tax=Luteococcus japonicus LSP_Lj1 TaxID=1255658 RepID=A0A1R4J113_9ACTN|nr:MFS transporter [Luteococcus japonicus]SJN25729.1 Alpha-ketoglutarate permease [Luteococcus japonicus LSP_Lj1]